MRSSHITFILLLLFSCRKDDILNSEKVIIDEDFTANSNWQFTTVYDTVTNSDTAWAEISNGQLKVGAESSGPYPPKPNYAKAKYDFSHITTDTTGVYVLDIGVVEPGFWESVYSSYILISLRIGGHYVALKGYNGVSLTNETLQLMINLNSNSFSVKNVSDNIDLSDRFVYYYDSNENVFEIQFHVGGTFNQQTQNFTSVALIVDKLKLTRVY